MSIPARRYIESVSSSYWIAPMISPSASITNVFSSCRNSSSSPSSRTPQRRSTSGSCLIEATRARSSRVEFRSVTRRPLSRTTLRPDVLVQPEDVVGVVGPLQPDQPVVLRVSVDRAHDVVSGLDHVVHVMALGGERGERIHRAAPPI